VLFTAEVQAAVTAAAGLNVNLRSVLEHAGTLAPVDCCGEERPERARRRRAPDDPADPDKLRIDPQSDVIPFDWELRDG